MLLLNTDCHSLESCISSDAGGQCPIHIGLMVPIPLEVAILNLMQRLLGPHSLLLVFL